MIALIPATATPRFPPREAICSVAAHTNFCAKNPLTHMEQRIVAGMSHSCIFLIRVGRLALRIGEHLFCPSFFFDPGRLAGRAPTQPLRPHEATGVHLKNTDSFASMGAARPKSKQRQKNLSSSSRPRTGRHIA